MSAATMHPLPEGTLARTATFVEGFDARVGTEFTVEDYVSSEDAEDGVAFYWGSNHGGFNNVTAAASSVEMVKTAAAMRARTVPTVEQVARGLSLLGDHEHFEADESHTDDDTVTLFGETFDGLRIAVVVRVLSVEQVDS